METSRPMNIHGIRALGFWIVMAAMLSSPAVLQADIPSPPATANVRISGIYKIVASSDPLFRVTKTHEYFLDFGRSSVAISLRQNPSVKVRIMAWEYFPTQETLIIGSPIAEGSRKAVAIGVWRVRGISGGLLCERGNHQVVLRRPRPGDY